jgi:hypothetical protein
VTNPYFWGFDNRLPDYSTVLLLNVSWRRFAYWVHHPKTQFNPLSFSGFFADCRLPLSTRVPQTPTAGIRIRQSRNA